MTRHAPNVSLVVPLLTVSALALCYFVGLGHWAAIDERLRATTGHLSRTMITAPVTDTVVDLQVTTAGGVVAAGEPPLGIVPKGAELLLDARVAPVDIDEIRAGLPVQVHLLADKGRNLPRIEGTVREVSVDRLQDPTNHQPYYLARVAIAPESLPAGVVLAAGMPAEVAIITSRRTLLDYLVRPLTDTLRRGLRES